MQEISIISLLNNLKPQKGLQDMAYVVAEIVICF